MNWPQLKAAFLRWWVNPAPPPEKIGQAKKHEYRPIPIELGFFMHADGTVYQRMRDRTGDRKVSDLKLKALVYEEYNRLLRLAKKQRAVHARVEAIKRAFRISSQIKAIRQHEHLDAKTKAST